MRRSQLTLCLLFLSSLLFGQEYTAIEVTSVHSGGLYILVQDGYAMNGELSNGALQTDNDFDLTKPFSLNDKHIWRIEGKSPEYKIRNQKTSKSIANSTSTTITFNNINNVWKFKYDEKRDSFYISNISEDRYLSSDLTITTRQFKAYKEQTYTNKYIKIYRILQIPESYERDLNSANENKLGTICLNRNVSLNNITNITFYSILGKQKNTVGQEEILLNEEKGTLLAGHSYIYHTTLDHLSLPYSEDFTDTPISSNGLIGSFEISENIYMPTNAYVLQDGQLKMVNENNSVLCAPHHAYINLDEVPRLPSGTSHVSPLRIKVFAKP